MVLNDAMFVLHVFTVQDHGGKGSNLLRCCSEVPLSFVDNVHLLLLDLLLVAIRIRRSSRPLPANALQDFLPSWFVEPVRRGISVLALIAFFTYIFLPIASQVKNIIHL
jgi:hypothetical protein